MDSQTRALLENVESVKTMLVSLAIGGSASDHQ